MPPSSYIALSEEERRKALIRISQFVIRDELEKVREELEESILEMALYYGTSKQQEATKNQIGELIEKEIYFISFPEYILEGILARLTSKGRIEKRGQEKYCLNDTRRKELHKIAKANQPAIEAVNQEVIAKTTQKYGKEASPEQQNEILTSFYSFLAYLFIDKSNVVARILTNKKVEIMRMELPIIVLNQISVKTIDDNELSEAHTAAIRELFTECTDTFANFLFSIMQNLTCIQILNLDPECVSLEREAFSKKVLLLDTNVLVSLLCPTRSHHIIAQELVKLSQTLGVKILVSKRTYREYFKLLDAANRAHQQLKEPEKVSEHLDDNFLSSFYLEKQTTPSQTWKGYFYRMKRIKSVLKRFNIAYYTDEHKELLKHPFFKVAKRAVNDCYKVIRGIGKNQAVCEHDAFHLLLIKELRKGETSAFLGPNYWFATFDLTLNCVDNVINSKSPYKNKTPSAMVCGIWLDMISPFLTYNVRNEKGLEIFAQLLRRQFAVLPFEIKTEELIEIQGDWIKYDWLTSEDIKDILSEKWVESYIKKVRKARRKSEPQSEIDELGSGFAQKLNEKLESIKTVKLESLQKKVVHMSKEFKYLEREQKKLKAQMRDGQETIRSQAAMIISEQRYKRRWRTVVGIAGLALIFSNLFFLTSGIFPRDYVTISCFTVCVIVGAILLYFAIAYERAKVGLEAKLP